MESSNFSKEFHVAPSSAVTRSGRPKDNAKRGAIIAAAKNLFGRQAFEVVTMEAVAAQAAVSKMTVYSHFRDKETLFETIVSTTADEMIGALSAPECDNDLRQRLTALGLAFLGVILGSDVCAMAHTLPGTLRSNRALAVRFYAAGPGRVRSALAAIISVAAERGELTIDDADRAADDLVSLWEGNMPAKIAFGLAEPISPPEIRRRAHRGTEVFLRAYRNEPDAMTHRAKGDDGQAAEAPLRLVERVNGHGSRSTAT
jgi:TetR/AcrR family transcriptional regulator, mexJK operon transcriptional repressor